MEIVACLRISYIEGYILHYYEKVFKRKHTIYLGTINLIVKNPIGNRFEAIFMSVYMFIQASTCMLL